MCVESVGRFDRTKATSRGSVCLRVGRLAGSSGSDIREYSDMLTIRIWDIFYKRVPLVKTGVHEYHQ